MLVFILFLPRYCLHIHDTPHAHKPTAAHTHVPEAPVLSRPQVHHPAPVVGLLVQQPVAVHHLAGHAVGHAVAVLDVAAVFHQLVHLTAKVLPFIDPHSELASVLFVMKTQNVSILRYVLSQNKVVCCKPCVTGAFILKITYHGNHAARPNAISHSHHAHVIGVLAPSHKILVSHEVGTLIDHDATALHPAGLTPAQVGGHIRTVTAGLIRATLKVPVLVEDDLKNIQNR